MTVNPRDPKRPLGNYDVGYGRPPKEHQFKKGEPSRNPKGRPRKGRVLQIVQVLTEPVTMKLDGREQRVPFATAWIQLTKSRALQGDAKAGRMIDAKAGRMIMELFGKVGLLDAPPRELQNLTIEVEYVNPRHQTEGDGPKRAK